MVKAHRISLDMLEEDVKQLISSTMKIFPVDYSFIEAGLNPNNFEFVRVTSLGQYKNHIYVWDDGWKLIGADDNSVDWGDVLNKPQSYKPITHTHTMSEIVDLPDPGLKVDKEEGKGLSSNDFTDDLLNKLNSLGDSATIDYTEMANRLTNHEENIEIHVTQLEKTSIGTIGQKAERNYVDTELAKKTDSTTFNGHLNSSKHITESGSNANGKYIKFDDGTMICTHKMEITADITTAAGAIFRGNSLAWVFPASFINDEIAISAFCGVSTLLWISSNAVTSASLGFYPMRHSSSPAISFSIHLSATGRWK